MSCIFSNCAECKFFKYTDKKKYVCKAFPDGIPQEYMFRLEQNANDECNNGIKFERAEPRFRA